MFVGGVRLTGAVNQPLNSALPLIAQTLSDAAIEVGASQFEGQTAQQILIGTAPKAVHAKAISVGWKDWRAFVSMSAEVIGDANENPLVGIAGGALAVGAAFDLARGRLVVHSTEVDLWPTTHDQKAPPFAEVFLPGSIWVLGLGNLGQAFLWALAALPYVDPTAVSLVLQDQDKISEENWSTSVLIKSETYGDLKTKVSETWARAKGFFVRRVDRRLLKGDRLDDDDPRMVLCGVDNVESRKFLANTGFDCIVDTGLGRKASDFNRYRVTVFDVSRPIDKHFEGQSDQTEANPIPDGNAYQQLQAEVGPCGAAEIAGASVAAPFVSAIAATVAVSRLIAIASGCACRVNEVRRVLETVSKVGPYETVPARGVRHAGKPLSTR